MALRSRTSCENMAGFPASPSAPIVFVQTLAHQVNQGDVESLIQSQRHMLLRFEKTNEMLVNCNELSATRFEIASRDMKRHTQTLLEMKKDIDSVFRRIRFLKMKLSQSYPSAFTACSKAIHVLDEEEEQDDNKDQLAETLQIPENPTQGQSSSGGSNSPSPGTSPSSSDTG